MSGFEIAREDSVQSVKEDVAQVKSDTKLISEKIGDTDKKEDTVFSCLDEILTMVSHKSIGNIGTKIEIIDGEIISINGNTTIEKEIVFTFSEGEKRIKCFYFILSDFYITASTNEDVEITADDLTYSVHIGSALQTIDFDTRWQYMTVNVDASLNYNRTTTNIRNSVNPLEMRDPATEFSIQAHVKNNFSIKFKLTLKNKSSYLVNYKPRAAIIYEDDGV